MSKLKDGKWVPIQWLGIKSTWVSMIWVKKDLDHKKS